MSGGRCRQTQRFNQSSSLNIHQRNWECQSEPWWQTWNKKRISLCSCRGRCHRQGFKIKKRSCCITEKKRRKTKSDHPNTVVREASSKCFSHAALVPLYPDHFQLTGRHRFCLFAECKYNAFYLPFNPFVAATCFKMRKFLSHFPLLFSQSYLSFMGFEIEPYISDTCYRPSCGSWCMDRHTDTKEPKQGSPDGPVIGLHHPGNETSLISIPAWHKPDKSCHLITMEIVREGKKSKNI